MKRSRNYIVSAFCFHSGQVWRGCIGLFRSPDQTLRHLRDVFLRRPCLLPCWATEADRPQPNGEFLYPAPQLCPLPLSAAELTVTLNYECTLFLCGEREKCGPSQHLTFPRDWSRTTIQGEPNPRIKKHFPKDLKKNNFSHIFGIVGTSRITWVCFLRINKNSMHCSFSVWGQKDMCAFFFFLMFYFKPGCADFTFTYLNLVYSPQNIIHFYSIA